MWVQRAHTMAHAMLILHVVLQPDGTYALGRHNGSTCSVPYARTGTSTLMPSGERTATALEAREAPTQAQVSAREADASSGRVFATTLGIRRLHSKPA